VSAEEMRYTVDSFPPSGEILLRGPIIFKGYYKNAKETTAVLDSDGWYVLLNHLFYGFRDIPF
jgi:long-chain acyl-CoA synthetase